MAGVPQNVNNPSTELIRVGTWGKGYHIGSPQNRWFFQLERNHHLKNITIDHGDLIYSLVFTSQLGESTYTSDKIGGWGRGPMDDGNKVSEVTFDGDEEINGISGTVALSRGNDRSYIIISSLSFTTNKKTHGPFGTVRGDPFTVSWGDARCAGFYGLCGGYLDSIGAYLKPHVEMLRIGTWGKGFHMGSPQNRWSYQLGRNHVLKNITIDHGDLIYSLIFTSKLGESTYTSDKIGGWGRGPMDDGDKVSEVTFDGDEEINGISGTVALSRGNDRSYIIISSLSFMTNKKTHGPFGTVRGDPFTVSWGDATCVGFYGLCGGYLDSIGAYLKPHVEMLKSTDGRN